MSAIDFLFNGQPPPAVQSSTASSTQFPTWLQNYQSALLSKANQVAGQSYTPYPGPQQAPFSPAQQQSFDLTQQNLGSYKPDMTAGAGALTQAAKPFDQATFDQFKSPYINDVVNRIGQLGTRNLQENLLPSVNSTFTGAGQFGSTRNADFTNRAVRDTNESILGQQAYALQGAQDAAMGAYNTAENRAGTAGTALGALGQAQQRAGLTDAAALNAVGGQQQQQQQGSLDIAQQNFLNQLNYPANQVNFLKNTISGLTFPSSTTSTTTGPLPGSSYGSSPLGTLAGALSLGSSLAGPISSGVSSIYNGLFGSGGLFGSRGGLVRLASGGPVARARSSRMGGYGTAIPRPSMGLIPSMPNRRPNAVVSPLRMMAAA